MLGCLAQGSGELVFLDNSQIRWLFKLGGIAQRSGEFVFVDYSSFE